MEGQRGLSWQVEAIFGDCPCTSILAGERPPEWLSASMTWLTRSAVNDSQRPMQIVFATALALHLASLSPLLEHDPLDLQAAFQATSPGVVQHGGWICRVSVEACSQLHASQFTAMPGCASIFRMAPWPSRMSMMNSDRSPRAA